MFIKNLFRTVKLKPSARRYSTHLPKAISLDDGPDYLLMAPFLLMGASFGFISLMFYEDLKENKKKMEEKIKSAIYPLSEEEYPDFKEFQSMQMERQLYNIRRPNFNYISKMDDLRMYNNYPETKNMEVLTNYTRSLFGGEVDDIRRRFSLSEFPLHHHLNHTHGDTSLCYIALKELEYIELKEERMNFNI